MNTTINYEEIANRFGKNDMIESLSDGVVRKYSGYLTLCGEGWDSFNKDLVVFKDGEYAKVIEKGVDHEAIERDRHIQNVRDTCKRLGCTTSELLEKDYIKELARNN